MNTYIHKKTCAGIFTTALFIMTKNRKQPKCPSVNEWINKWWYSHTMECLTVKRRELLLSHNVDKSKTKAKQTNKKNMLSKRSQIKRIQTAWFYLHKVLNQAKRIPSDRNQNSGCLSWEESAWKEAQGNFWDEGHILRKYLGLRKCLDWGGGYMGVCICETKLFKLYI